MSEWSKFADNQSLVKYSLSADQLSWDLVNVGEKIWWFGVEFPHK